MPNAYEKVTKQIKPDWLKIKLHSEQGYAQVAQIVKDHSLHTICGSGMCPNRAECWSRRTATFMIMGEVCTRSCKFCATQTGRPLPLETSEPQRVADSVRLMGLKHAVITSVTRDDLPDGGAAHWADVVGAVRAANPKTSIELLIPDMDAKPELLDIIIESKPDIIGHNIETVERLTSSVRSRATYATSMKVLEYLASKGCIVKSGLMIGLGETRDEIVQTLKDLYSHGCRIVTLGQYLRPTLKHHPVAEYITPQEFERLGKIAEDIGFSYVASAPMVRSSYLADQALESCKIKK